MKMIVGLGNPGAPYEKTRHNVGFRVVEKWAREEGQPFKKSWWIRAEQCRLTHGGEPVWLIKPLTFMNRSGWAVRALMRRLKVQPEEVIVVYDDVHLGMGRLRIRRGGSAGGHNGVQSLIDHVGSDGVARIRIGIEPAYPVEDRVDYVLAPFKADEESLIKGTVDRTVLAIKRIIEKGIESAMNEYNG